MAWLREVLDRLAQSPCCGYYADAPPATEPTAMAAMALIAHGCDRAAAKALEWLAGLQAGDGHLPVDATQTNPGWATGWAILAWRTALNGIPRSREGEAPADRGKSAGLAAATAARQEPRSPGVAERQSWTAAAERAADWILATQGRALPQSPLLGHDMTLQAWAWTEGTTSWVEPTAINLLALKAAGHAGHERCRKAVQLLRDRAIPTGGWNCGNKVVFGAVLRAHLQPTGLALAALAREEAAATEIRRAVAYLEKALSPAVTTASLSYALIGLAGHGRRPGEADAWLAAACRKTLQEGAPPYQLALAALAASGKDCPWFCPPAAREKR